VLRVAGIALVVLGVLALLLAMLGLVLVEAELGAIQCPDDVQCIDHVTGRGVYTMLGMAGLIVAAVGGAVVLADSRRRARRKRWVK